MIHISKDSKGTHFRRTLAHDDQMPRLRMSGAVCVHAQASSLGAIRLKWTISMDIIDLMGT